MMTDVVYKCVNETCEDYAAGPVEPMWIGDIPTCPECCWTLEPEESDGD